MLFDLFSNCFKLFAILLAPNLCGPTKIRDPPPLILEDGLDQKNMKDFIEMVTKPVNFDTLATQGSACGTFVHLGCGRGNANMLQIALDAMWNKGAKMDDIAAIINAPAQIGENKNAFDSSCFSFLVSLSPSLFLFALFLLVFFFLSFRRTSTSHLRLCALAETIGGCCCIFLQLC